jgi:hypothetical protein
MPTGFQPMQPPAYFSDAEKQKWLALTSANGNPTYKEPFWFWAGAPSLNWETCVGTNNQQYAACNALYNGSWTPVVAHIPPYMEDRQQALERAPRPSKGGGEVIVIPEIQVYGKTTKPGILQTSGGSVWPIIAVTSIGCLAIGLSLKAVKQ